MNARRSLAALVAVAALSLSACSSEPIRGTVIDRSFSPGGCSVGVVLVNGNASTVTSCTSDEWVLVIEKADGELVTRSVDSVTYARFSEGELYAEEGAK